MERISVAVRFRPSNAVSSPGDREWRIQDNRITLHRPLGTPIAGVSFAFDHVFDDTCRNALVYNVLIKSIIDAALAGFNGTAFAYGQTSSGKTFTMNGSEYEAGIIQLAVKDIFDSIEEMTDREFLIRVSYMEIYNEEINDLLSLGSERLQIHESLDRGIYVAGLREEVVNNAEQVLQIIKLGEANRRFGETNMNARSSRSHSIFRMVVESSVKESASSGEADAIRVSVLNLVDLAGSERVAKTGAGGVRLKEGKYINKSLMILGNVINKLSENCKQRGHIPYRDSKLTRILQPALGGNSKTSIICTVAPEEIHVEETRGTLQFASRAKQITNCAQVNEILTDAALLKRQKLEIEELRRKLQGSQSEVLEQMILKQRNDMLKSELEKDRLASELQEEKRSRKALEECVRELQMKIDESIKFSNNVQEKTNFTSDEFTRLPSDFFQTPDFKSIPIDYVGRRPHYSLPHDSSPVPDVFSNVADEDMWNQLNKGHTTDLDLLQMSPSVNSFVSSNLYNGSVMEESTRGKEQPCFNVDCTERSKTVMDLQDKNSSLETECRLLKEEMASVVETLTKEKEELYGKTVMELQDKNSSLEIECRLLKEEMASVVETLTKEKEELLYELNLEKQKMNDFKEQPCSKADCTGRSKMLIALQDKYSTLETECRLLKEEKASAVGALIKEKEDLTNELSLEKQKMNHLKEELRRFRLAFTQRESMLTSLHAKSKALVENLNSCPVPKATRLEC